MGRPHLTKVEIGINTKTFKPIWYVKARLGPSKPWRLITDGKKWITHRSSEAAKRAARKLEKRLWERLEA